MHSNDLKDGTCSRFCFLLKSKNYEIFIYEHSSLDLKNILLLTLLCSLFMEVYIKQASVKMGENWCLTVSSLTRSSVFQTFFSLSVSEKY